MKLEISSDDLKSKGSNKYIGEGTTVVRIANAEKKTSKAGNDYYRVTFEDADGAETWDNFMCSGKGTWKTVALARAIGYDDERIAGLDMPVDFLAKSCNITIKITGKETYMGKERNVYDKDYSVIEAKGSFETDAIPF